MARLTLLCILLCSAWQRSDARPIRRSELPPGTSFVDVEQNWDAKQNMREMRLIPIPTPISASTGTLYVDEVTGRLRFHFNGTFHNVYTQADVVPSSVQYQDGGVGVGPFETINIVGTGIDSSLDGTTLNVTVDSGGGGGGGNVPAGTVISYAGSTEPSGYLFCYGQEVSRATYSDLFTAIGTTYGVGDGSTTFNLPDLRGRTVFGRDNMGGLAANRITNSGTGNPGIDGTSLGATGGADRYALQAAQMPGHTHGLDYVDADLGVGTNFQVAVENGLQGTYQSESSGSDEEHPQMPPTIILNYLVKY